MKRLLLSDLNPGMVAAEDIYSYDEQLIVAKNTRLTDSIIRRLEFFSIPSIRIDDTVPAAEEKAPAAEEKSQPAPAAHMSAAELAREVEYQKFKAGFEVSLNDFKNNINDIVEKNTPIDTKTAFANAVQVLSGESSTYNFFHMLHSMRSYDDLTYAHSMNVALICNVFARWLKLSDEEVEIATLSGLFHDIGKLTIPDSIIKKAGKLTDEEYQTVKTHTVRGYNILKEQAINEHIKMAALMHHERCDGGGYPLGVKADKIDKYARIVSIADVYDAMTAARVYRGALCPFTVIENFEKEGLQRYDTEFILCFLENVVMTYMNSRVRLSDGREGEVVFLNRNMLSKPMVQCADGFVDLAKEKDLSIVEML